MQVVGDGDELVVAGEAEQGAVEGAVGLPVRGGVAVRGGGRGRLGEGAQRLPARGGDGAGEAQDDRDLDEGADLGQLGEFARGALDDAEAAVRDDLDGALGGQALHRLPYGGGGHAEAQAQGGGGVHAAGDEVAAEERGAQRVEDLAAHGVAPDRAGRAGRRFAVGVRAAGLLGDAPGGVRTPLGPLRRLPGPAWLHSGPPAAVRRGPAPRRGAPGAR